MVWVLRTDIDVIPIPWSLESNPLRCSQISIKSGMYCFRRILTALL